MDIGPHMTYGCLPSGVVVQETAGQSALDRKKRGGFTLVEIMIVVVIIGLLAAMALPTFRRVTLRSQASRLANDFRQFESAFERYCMQNGSWPPATGMGIIPAGMEGVLPESYTQVSPLGGQYLWTGPGQDVVLRGTFATDELMESVDKTLDDGNLTTGDFTKLSSGTFGYHAH